MKFAAAKEHRDFFRRHGWIEFEGLLKPEQLEHFNTAIDVGMGSRLSTTVDKLKDFSGEDLFMAGRDLWRANDAIKKVVWQANFAEFVAELVEKRPIRLAYDQLFPKRMKKLHEKPDSFAYSKLLSTKATLEEVSCFERLAGGLMICLSGLPKPKQTEEPPQANPESGVPLEPKPEDIFSFTPGNAIFFRPDLPISFETFYNHPEARFFLIAYADENSYYVLKDADAHSHALKHLGFSIGQKLAAKHNPILCR